MSDPDNADPQSRTSQTDAYQTLVDRWFVETFHGSVLARTTEIWNLVHAAKEDLKQRLAALLTSFGSDAPHE